MCMNRLACLAFGAPWFAFGALVAWSFQLGTAVAAERARASAPSRVEGPELRRQDARLDGIERRLDELEISDAALYGYVHRHDWELRRMRVWDTNICGN